MDIIGEFPADYKHIALYLTSLVQENKSYAVIDSTFYAIKYFHVIAKKALKIQPSII